jgi:hypothetical protein
MRRSARCVGEDIVSDKLEDDFAGLGAPARRALAGAGFTRLADLTEVTEAQLKKLHGMGPKALGMLRRKLDDNGKSFKNGRD